MQAMLLAAGLGTRLKPLTENIPKALVALNGMTLLEIALRRLIENDFRKIIINVHHLSDKVMDFLDRNTFAADIIVSDESELLLDTGGGIKHALQYFDNSPVLIHNVDVISDLNLKEFYNYHVSDDALASLCVSKRKSSRYLLFNKDNVLCGWQDVNKDQKIIVREETDLDQYAFNGIHILNPELIRSFPDEKVFSVIKAYLRLAGRVDIIAYQSSDLRWIDVGKPESLSRAAEMVKEFYQGSGL